MPDHNSLNNDFLSKVTEIIEENISNEQFGVSELAREAGMSRSNLLRKIKKLTKLSASQFISQVRLKNAMEMLKQNSLNVSEVSYEVGFSSTSYFIKCFREHYGYPPGEVGKGDVSEYDSISTDQPLKKRRILISGLTMATVLLAVTLFIVFKPSSAKQKELEKSIAVLPFINDSNDSSNVHIINGLMESLLNNLQQIKGLRVVSRTSVEKFRNNTKTISEIGKELNVNYFVEGSGQKIGDEILLSVQLIEASSDKHLWAAQYTRDAKDIFDLQMEVAKDIAEQVQVIITPEVEKRIEKVPTDDLVAYDFFLKGLDLLYEGTHESLLAAIPYFEKAIEQDNEFANAYADLAMTYFFLDIYSVEKKYADQINSNADKALLFDSELEQSLIAKALYYMYTKEYSLAVPYLEKALEYNPNSAMVINTLADFYTNVIPNTEKYLEYALKGIRLDIAAQDSVTASYTFLHVSNALIQSGFTNEAEIYINKSLNYNPENLYSAYVKAYILFAKDGNLQRTKELILEALEKDTTRLDIIQEVGKICYSMRDYESAYVYFKRLVDIREAQKLNIYSHENAKIGFVYSEIGLIEESEKLFQSYKEYAENNQSIYKHLSLAMYYSYKGETKDALEHLELFSHEDNYFYWIILFLEIDPLVDNIKDLPEFKKIVKDIKSKFWKNHKRIKSSLIEKELL